MMQPNIIFQNYFFLPSMYFCSRHRFSSFFFFFFVFTPVSDNACEFTSNGGSSTLIPLTTAVIEPFEKNEKFDTGKILYFVVLF